MDAAPESANAVLDCTSEPGVTLSVASGDIIGREGDVDITLLKDAEYLSRKHARFHSKGGKWLVENLSTKSFTYVNGKQVPPNAEVEIETGDRLTFGIIRCTFQEA
ncbi:MAG: FHA domain-containing protein [Candidatus Geothermincolia bacterium]